MKDLLDGDGENRAVRAFLLGLELGIKFYGPMKVHMTRMGYPYWPEEFARLEDMHISKNAQQHWLRHLFDLEKLPPAQVLPPDILTLEQAEEHFKNSGKIHVLGIYPPEHNQERGGGRKIPKEYIYFRSTASSDDHRLMADFNIRCFIAFYREDSCLLAIKSVKEYLNICHFGDDTVIIETAEDLAEILKPFSKNEQL